jgi:predicted aconitase
MVHTGTVRISLGSHTIYKTTMYWSRKLAKAGARVSVTKNLGNFESLKIEEWLETDARPGESPEDALDRVYKIVYAHVEKKLAEENQ